MGAKIVLAFDVYGTLVDTAGVRSALAAEIGELGLAAEIGEGELAAKIAARWREKQLEYSFRRALMRAYADFSICARDALVAVCAEAGIDLPPAARARLLAAHARLPLFADVRPALEALTRAEIPLFAFSNGARAAVREVLENGGAADFFADIVSADEIRDFKPSPVVYAHFLRRAQAQAESTWLVSSNPFDVTGARRAGWSAVWVRRGGAIFDPWDDFAPSATIDTLTALPRLLETPPPRE